MRRRLGIAIGRKEASLAGLVLHGRSARIAATARAPLRDAAGIPGALEALLAGCPAELSSCDVALAVSPAFLACADCFEAPLRTERQLESVAASLCEGRSTGEVAESLVADAVRVAGTEQGSLIHAVAISAPLLAAIRASIRKALPHSRLTLVTAAPLAAAQCVALAEPCGVLTQSGAQETIELARLGDGRNAWRAYPHDGPPGAPAAAVALLNGLKVEPDFVCAAAAALCDLKTTANVLRGVADSSASASSVLRPAGIRALAAAALLMLAAGVYFDKKAAQSQAALDQLSASEAALSQKVLPGRRTKSGDLADAMRKAIADHERAQRINRMPSALAFWGEISTALPNADAIGMTLDSLQLGPDGGRLLGRVNAQPGNPLANAARLESALNSSEFLAARGEFETKEKDAEVIVRMRLDYKSPAREEVAKP